MPVLLQPQVADRPDLDNQPLTFSLPPIHFPPHPLPLPVGERGRIRGNSNYLSLIFYHISPLLFIDNPIFFYNPKNCPTFLQS
jgi:hypothetical protein